MGNISKVVCIAVLAAPLLAAGAAYVQLGPQAAPPSGGSSARGGGGGPQNTAAGGGGFRGGGGGFRGGFRGDGFRGYGGGFRGSIFIGPGFGYGYYDPFYAPYYYYPPPSVREYAVPQPDYLAPPGGPAPEPSWFHCDNPEGYYPYVRSCNGQWQAVPVTPDRGPPPPPQGGGAPPR